jgi:hypothetical protein
MARSFPAGTLAAVMLEAVRIELLDQAAFRQVFRVAAGHGAVGYDPFAVVQTAAGAVAGFVAPFDAAAPVPPGLNCMLMRKPPAARRVAAALAAASL